MKNGIKMMMLITIAIAFCTSLNAQKHWRMGVSANAGIATNNLYGLVLGSDIRFQKGIESGTSFIFTTGVTHFFDTDKTANGFTYVPAKVGIKSFIASKLYVSGEVGAGFSLNKGTSSSFLWSPSLGYSFKNVDVSVKYEDYAQEKNYKQVALRIAYGFKL